jgi:hypothetical protein
MKLTWASGNIGVVVEKTAGTVHTTNIYIIPWELTIGAAGFLCILIWALLRKRRASDSTTQS